MSTRASRIARLAALAWLCFGAFACADARDVPAGTPGVTVRDSMGVEIAESAAPAWGAGEGWTIDPVPVLQIGVAEGEEAYQFSRIVRAVELPDGGFVVVDSREPFVRVFDSEGLIRSTIGRAGEGPGEFMRSPGFAVAAPDTLVTWENSRVSWFLLDGSFIRDQRIEMTELRARFGGSPPRGDETHVGPDGSLLTSAAPYVDGLGETPRAKDQTVYLLAAGLATDRTLGTWQVSQAVQRGYAIMENELANDLVYTRHPLTGAIHLVHAGPMELRTMSATGDLVRIARAAVPRLPITDEMIQARRASWAARVAPEGDELGHLEAFDLLTFPDSTPAIGALESDPVGRVWARRWTPPEEPVSPWWEVLAEDGGWLGAVEVSPELGDVLSIGERHLLTVWRDELDVPYVRVYRIERGAA